MAGEASVALGEMLGTEIENELPLWPPSSVIALTENVPGGLFVPTVLLATTQLVHSLTESPVSDRTGVKVSAVTMPNAAEEPERLHVL
jgi:hypothetical protein